MNARRVDAASRLICVSQKRKQTAAGIAADLEAACMLQSPESAEEQRELRQTLEQRTELLREVQAIARQRMAEAKGRKAYGDRLKAENAELRARVAELLVERHTTNEALSDVAEELRARRDQIAELETERKKYVGVEPTIAEEMAYLSRCLDAVYAVCETAEKQATRWEQPLPVPEWVALIRNAADGVTISAPALPPAPQRQTEDPHDGPLASRYAIPHDLPTKIETFGSAL